MTTFWWKRRQTDRNRTGIPKCAVLIEWLYRSRAGRGWCIMFRVSLTCVGIAMSNNNTSHFKNIMIFGCTWSEYQWRPPAYHVKINFATCELPAHQYINMIFTAFRPDIPWWDLLHFCQTWYTGLTWYAMDIMLVSYVVKDNVKVPMQLLKDISEVSGIELKQVAMTKKRKKTSSGARELQTGMS